MGTNGSEITYTGTLVNNSGSEMFLNGAGGSLPNPELTFDVTPFFLFTPPSLADGATYNGPLFAVAISEVALPGQYLGAFSIQGGLDPFTFDTVASTNFEADVVTLSRNPALLP
jgi:hypothetical protein